MSGKEHRGRKEQQLTATSPSALQRLLGCQEDRHQCKGDRTQDRSTCGHVGPVVEKKERNETPGAGGMIFWAISGRDEFGQKCLHGA